MAIHRNYPITALNTFKMNIQASFFSVFSSIKELIQIINDPIIKDEPLLLLGGGSNILFTKNFKGLILKNDIKGIEIVSETESFVYVKSGAGENWHQFVIFCINNNLGGVENLSLIPGTVGASPIQNIGAYGAEVKDVIQNVEFLNLTNTKIEFLKNEDCKFGYRESIFKTEMKGTFIITSVTFKLHKKPVLNIAYGAINDILKLKNIINPDLKDISNAVCEIRKSKLPDPNEIGNAGSFFKNPEVPFLKYESLKNLYPEIPSYPTSDGFVKIPAGWLIEKCGWKGKTFGNYGVHKNQALVLVNYGGADGNEIKNLAENIKQSINTNFGIFLETEVNII